MSSNIENLMSSLFGNQVQDLENAIRTLLFRLDIDKMEGVMLNKIGTIVNQSRLGYNDEYYRILLKARIGINVSGGDIEKILTLWKLLSQSENFSLVESFPAKILLSTDVYLGDDVFNFMKDFAQQALSGGVGLHSILVTDPDRFGFGSGRGNFDTSNWANSY